MTFVGRLILKGTIRVVSGLHIGTGTAGGIGLIDNPIIRDPLTQLPIVPGSSLKGRLRHALEMLLGGDEKHREVLKLFGGAPDDSEGAGLTRLYVRDAHLKPDFIQKLESIESESSYVEIKTENRIDRSTGTAEHPRQSERLPAGSLLELEMVYNCFNKDEVPDDLQNLRAAMQFVQDEYLGGSGSRGYGQVKLDVDELTWKRCEDYRDGNEVKSVKVQDGDWLSLAYKLVGVTAGVRK
ncbi:MAG TPA: type III-A CRISPR-associated RAMP protein Csm3 [Candidatus Obscuribacterales bacterium]